MLEGDGNYTHIYFSCGRKTLSSYTLMRYEKALDGFHRVSRKHLVNPKFVLELEASASNTHLLLHNGHRIKVPRRKVKNLCFV